MAHSTVASASLGAQKARSDAFDLFSALLQLQYFEKHQGSQHHVCFRCGR